MENIQYLDSKSENWDNVAEGIEMLVLRSMPGENRVLLRLAPGCGYPVHSHSVAEEVFVLEGVYVDPDEGKGIEHGPGSYLYYAPGTSHNATTPTGCTFMVINNKPTPVR